MITPSRSESRTPCHLVVDAGERSGLVAVSENRMTLRFENALVTVHGAVADFARELVEALEGTILAGGSGSLSTQQTGQTTDAARPSERRSPEPPAGSDASGIGAAS